MSLSLLFCQNFFTLSQNFRRHARICVLTVLLSLTTLTNGYANYKDQIPNGGQVPHPCNPNYLWRGVGHTNPLGGGDRNAFGVDFLAHGATWNVTLCQLDSDGDGLTNGEELGDPDCTWTPGTLPKRTTSLTHPGVCDPWGHPNCTKSNTWVNCDTGSFECDAVKDPGMKVPSAETNYMCMTFDLPDDDVYQLVATEPVIDNAQLLHHIILYGCGNDADVATYTTPTPCGMAARKGCVSIMTIWGLGFPGTCVHKDTGFKFGRGLFTRVKMEVHWNNPELRGDYKDSSGLRLYYTPKLRPTSAFTFSVGQMYLEIPPLQPSVQISGSCNSKCSRQMFTQPVYVADAFNHMHYLGKSQKIEVFRDGELFTTLTNDEFYNYDSPVLHVFEPPVQLLPGDELKTTCTFNSEYKNTTTHYGEGTSDEMCFGFLTMFPRDALPYGDWCTGYKSMTYCGFCDLTNINRTWAAQVGAMVLSSCSPYGPCRPECRQIVDELQNRDCFQDDNFEIVMGFIAETGLGTYFTAAVNSCMGSKYTEPRSIDDNNADDTDDASSSPTSAATIVLPGLVSMVTMLLVAIFGREL